MTTADRLVRGIGEPQEPADLGPAGFPEVEPAAVLTPLVGHGEAVELGGVLVADHGAVLSFPGLWSPAS